MTSFRAVGCVLLRRRRFVGITIGGLLAACIFYCLIAPKEYEASARVALRSAPVTTLHVDDASESSPGASSSSQAQLETLADVFRSNQLAWSVILDQKLYAERPFAGSRFAQRFPHFHAEAPDPEAQAWLIERFQRRLNVRTIPRTLIVQIRFWSRDPALSAAIVNGMIHAYSRQQSAAHSTATADAAALLTSQLDTLRSNLATRDKRLLQFQQRHGLLDTPSTLANGQLGDTEHATALTQIDDLTRDLSAAEEERVLREAEYRAAQRGSPELVVVSDPHLQEQGAFATALLQQLHARRSELQLEESQLAIEHGPNFPRVVEIRAQLQDIDTQIAAEDKKLIARFHEAFQTAVDREQLLRQSLAKLTAEGMKLNAAATEYAAMRQETNASQELYTRLAEKAQEALLTAGLANGDIVVIDPALQPVKPSSPNLPVYLALTFLVSTWIAILGALMFESFTPPVPRTAAALLVALLMATHSALAQAPTPSTSGLPTGVARIPQSGDNKSQPNAKDAPEVWVNPASPSSAPLRDTSDELGSAISALLAPGDVLSVSEIHTPEFRTTVRVSSAGAISLPFIDEVQVNSLDESAAAHVIENALVKTGILLHPQVLITVLSYAGQDVSVLGEVVRPGVYPYAAHHRLLDLISAASGFASSAGSLVTIAHRDSQQPSLAVTLASVSDSAVPEANPELQPGDTVQVSRAGLVYVIGDVMRPGGFPVDPAQHLTLVQALTLSWGPTQNAALTKAVLIREQKGGRTMTMLNLKRLLRGEDPDLPIHDRDIIFVPDSAAKNLWNRTMESVVQSAAGVSIYAGLVYSQRF